MNDVVVMEKLAQLSIMVARLERRIEDLEDLRDLEQAIAENEGRPLISWEQAKTELELD